MMKKYLWFGMLTVTLVFIMTTTGCSDEDETKKDDVTVTFNANGGKWDDGSTIKSVKVPYNYEYDRLSNWIQNPTWQGYSFNRWQDAPYPNTTNAINTGGNQKITSDRTVYALWRY
jgi:hypothetical protein